jgi:malate synthase
MLLETQQIEICNSTNDQYTAVLTEEALEFLSLLHQKFNHQRVELLNQRKRKQKEIDSGILPNFSDTTKKIRESEWYIAPLPHDLQDRRVEITGPVDRKMIINALNSGAKVFMADFEDANSPVWSNVIEGQINLYDAIRRQISFTDPVSNKPYTLKEKTATLLVRPRGWHLDEKNLYIAGQPLSGSLVDFGLYFFHNAAELIERHSGPYFYLPKLESHLEARLWNDVFVFAQDYLQIPQGTIKATVLIETILASFEMDEILYELKNHSAGLNCGRWDYIFSFIKKFKNFEGFVLPERSQVTMATPFMESYSKLVIDTCHRRKAPAIGGMAAFIPIKGDEEANNAVIENIIQDKLREVKNGHDGTWVAHPGLVPVAMKIFDEHMTCPNQIHIRHKIDPITSKHLLEIPNGTITEKGLRTNIYVGIRYLESWLRGNGAVAIRNLMEDAATAEISRTQLWQWIKNKSHLDDGRIITRELYQQLKKEEIEYIKVEFGVDQYPNLKFIEAIEIFDNLVLDEEYKDFLTLPAYTYIS